LGHAEKTKVGRLAIDTGMTFGKSDVGRNENPEKKEEKRDLLAPRKENFLNSMKKSPWSSGKSEIRSMGRPKRVGRRRSLR